MRTLVQSRPNLAVLGIYLGAIVVEVISAVVLGALLPDWTPFFRSALVVVVLAVYAAVLLSALGWWSAAGFTGVSDRGARLVVWIPVIFGLMPLIGGIVPTPPDTLLLLVVGYAATALYEESLFRGIILRVLSPKGVWKAVIITSVLFGLIHLTNVMFRDNVGLVFAQALGAGTAGVGYAALRLRSGSLWPSIAVHFVYDFLLQLSGIGGPARIALMVTHSTVLMVYGIWLIHRMLAVRQSATGSGSAGSSSASVSRMYASDQ